MNRTSVVILVLVLLLLVAGVFITITLVKNYQRKEMLQQQTIYQQGIQAGFNLAVRQLLQQASTCRVVPVYADNVTLNLVAVECLQQKQPVNTSE